MDLYWCHSNYTKNGKKKPNNFSSVLCNTWTTENSFCAENANSLLTTLHIRHSLQAFTPVWIHVPLWLLLSFVLCLFHHCFFHSSLEFFSHMSNCAAQLYQSAVLSLSILKCSFIPLTELEEKRFSYLWTSLVRSSTRQMKWKFEFWLLKSKIKIAILDWKSVF